MCDREQVVSLWMLIVSIIHSWLTQQLKFVVKIVVCNITISQIKNKFIIIIIIVYPNVLCKKLKNFKIKKKKSFII